MSDELKEMKEAAESYFNENQESHYGHGFCLVTDALMAAQDYYDSVYGHYSYFGVEGDADYDLLYLNAGDAYAETLCYHKGEFIITSWGDIVESVDNEKEVTNHE